MINIAICDDEKKQQEIVRELVENSTQFKGIAYDISCFSSGSALISSENIATFHLIFLDIVMENGDGVETLETLKKQDCFVVFMSTTSDRLRELFHRNVLGFLDKPINEKEFELKISEFLKNYLKITEKTFTFELHGMPKTVLQRDIVYFENFGHYIHLHSTKEVYVFRQKIGDLWQQFHKEPTFALANRSFIVNLNYCSLASKNSLFVEFYGNKTEIQVGRTRKEDTLKRLMNFASQRKEY